MGRPHFRESIDLAEPGRDPEILGTPASKQNQASEVAPPALPVPAVPEPVGTDDQPQPAPRGKRKKKR